MQKPSLFCWARARGVLLVPAGALVGLASTVEFGPPATGVLAVLLLEFLPN